LPDLLLDDIGLAGVEDVGLNGVAAGDAVGVLGVGQIGDGNAVDGVERDGPIVRLAPPQPGSDHVCGHGGPEAEGCGNAGSALVVGVVVGQAEHPEPRPVKGVGAVPGGGKAGVGGGGQFVGAQSLLVDPVHIKIAVKGDQV